MFYAQSGTYLPESFLRKADEAGAHVDDDDNAHDPARLRVPAVSVRPVPRLSITSPCVDWTRPKDRYRGRRFVRWAGN